MKNRSQISKFSPAAHLTRDPHLQLDNTLQSRGAKRPLFESSIHRYCSWTSFETDPNTSQITVFWTPLSTDTVPGLHLKPVQKTMISPNSVNFVQITTELQRGHPTAAAWRFAKKSRTDKQTDKQTDLHLS